MLSRPRLIEFLNQHLDRKLLLLCAPAGYGKTTLLVDFAKQTTVPVCWYTLSQSDADPQVFLEYLVAAIRQQFPSFGDRTIRYLRNAGAHDLEVIAGLFISDLHEVADRCFMTVLDDYHNVDDQPAIQSLLNLIIANLPANCCWVLSSRTIPRIRLSRLVANREAAGLGDSDLRFTAAEIQHLFSRHYNLLIPEALAEDVAREAEGWIAGIILTSHSLWQGLFKGMIQTKRAGGPVFDYLASEVFDHQEAPLREFLLDSSILSRLSPARCDTLLESQDSASLLRTLDESNLFITRLGGVGEWYRYHTLFQEFLQARLQQTDPGRFKQLHLQAGTLLEDDGDFDAALDHYLRAEEPERAVDLVERLANQTFDDGRIHTLLQWSNRLPPNLLDTRPRLQIARARAAFEASDLALGQRALESALAASYRVNDQSLIASALIWRSMSGRSRGHFDEAIADCRHGLALAEKVNDAELIALGSKQLGIILLAAGLSTEAIPALERALASYAAMGDHRNQGVICHSLGITWRRQGDAEQAHVVLDEACRHWRAIGNDGMLAGTLVVLGNLHYDFGETDAARTVLSEAQHAAQESGYLRLEGYAIETLGDVLRDGGDFAPARVAYEQSLAIAEKVGDQYLQIVTLEGLSRCHLYAGESGLAHATVIRARHLANERESVYERAICEDTYGLICLETDRIEAAITALEQAATWLASSGWVRELARTRLHLAQARLQTGDRIGARELAQSGLELLPARARDPLLAIEATRLAGALRLAEPDGPPWLHEIVERLGPAPEPPPQKPAIVLLPGDQRVRSIRCYTLGRADVEIDGQPLASGDWPTQKAKELWFYLLAQGPIAREQIIEALWPDAEAGKGLSAFHTTIHRVRRTLFADCVERRGELWGVAPSVKIWTDDREFEELAEKSRTASTTDSCGTRHATATQAVALYHGPYLNSIDTAWSDGRRRRIQTLYLRLLRSLLEEARDAKRYEEVIAFADRFLQTDPDDEGIHETLMRSHASLGNPTAALRHYQRYAEQLRQDLATQPSRRLRQLSEQIAREG